ncbi:MAG TPA: hypothetical protein VK786_05260 [bacterium]|nr:hypothetical protein [bacterium]
MFCVSCDYELESQGNFCPRCKQPTISQDKPRQVRLAQSFGIYSKIAVFGILFVVLCASFIYYIDGPLAVSRYGRHVNAVITSVTATEHGRGGTGFTMEVQYIDGRGYARIGTANASAQEFLAQPVGKIIPIRYFNGYPYIGRDGPDDVFDEWFTVVFFALALLLLATVRNILRARKRLLENGNLHSAVMTNFFGHNTRFIQVEYGDPKIVRKFVFRGAKPPKMDSSLWILEDGTEKGITILDQDYEWECVH